MPPNHYHVVSRFRLAVSKPISTKLNLNFKSQLASLGSARHSNTQLSSTMIAIRYNDGIGWPCADG